MFSLHLFEVAEHLLMRTASWVLSVVFPGSKDNARTRLGCRADDNEGEVESDRVGQEEGESDGSGQEEGEGDGGGKGEGEGDVGGQGEGEGNRDGQGNH